MRISIILMSIAIAIGLFLSCTENSSDVGVTNLDSRTKVFAPRSITNPCGDVTEVPLCAGQNIVVGTVTVANDSDEICVTYTITDLDWWITQTHLDLEPDPALFPMTPNGNPIPGHFAYGDPFDPPVQEAEYCFNLAALGYEVNETVYVAAHAVVQSGLSAQVQVESAWGDGCAGTGFPGPNWATYFYHVVQPCEPIQPEECDSLLAGLYRTQTQGGWGSECHGQNPGCYRDEHFADCFTSGLVVGCTTGYTVTYTTSLAIQNSLPTGGTPAALEESAVDPGSEFTGGGVLLGQVVALTLSVGFDVCDEDFSPSDIPLGDLVVCDTSSIFEGWTVGEVLNEANLVLGGCSQSYSPSDINDVVSSINENFVDGTIDRCFLCENGKRTK